MDQYRWNKLKDYIQKMKDDRSIEDMSPDHIAEDILDEMQQMEQGDVMDRYCPHCGADLRGERIPDDIRDNYGSTYFYRQIGIYDVNSDRVTAYVCPDCGGQWERINE